MADSPDEHQPKEMMGQGRPRRPPHEPPHQRFFEDGEEPPERYDLSDELAYILPDEYSWNPRRWFAIAGRHFRANWSELLGRTLSYLFACWMIGACSFGLLLPFLEPVLRIALISYCMGCVTGKRDRYLHTFSTGKHLIRLAMCQL